MVWSENDDTEVQENLDRLLTEQKNLNSQLNPIEISINNFRRIQTKIQTTQITEKGKKIAQITKIKPKDEWDNDMTDEDRLKDKDECVAKTIELLGEPNE